MKSSIMKKISAPIVFFGSGPVAAKSLDLLKNNFVIEAVITKPRAPHHKGDVPVITLAERLNLPTYTVSTKRELNSLFLEKPFSSQLGILIDFGIIVPQEVITYFPLGIINSHFSVLPEWRGADPITFAILSGQKKTGVSLMLLVEAMDEGPLLSYKEYSLPDSITTPQLTEQLIKLSHNLLMSDIPNYLEGKSTTPQTVTGRRVSYSRKLTKEDGHINWQKPANQLEREIRAFLEWPKSYTSLGGKEVVITQAYALPDTPAGDKPGSITVLKKAEAAIVVTTGEGSLYIQRLKPNGKREMSAREFLAGNKL